MATPPRDFREWMRQVERKLQQAVRSGNASAVTALNREAEKIRQEVAESSVDNRIPSAPVEFTYQTELDTDANGKGFGRVHIDFTAVTRATNGTNLAVDSYELWGRDETKWSGTGTAPAWKVLGTSKESQFTHEPVTAGAIWRYRIRALGLTTVLPGEWSVELVVNIGRDTTPPPILAAPVLTAKLGTVTLTSDGLAANGAQMPADYSHTEVLFDDQPDPQTRLLRTFRGAFSTVIIDLPYNVPHYARIRAVDHSGNASNWSAVSTVTVTPLVSGDISGLDTTLEQQIDRAEAAESAAEAAAADAVAAEGRANQAAQTAADAQGNASAAQQAALDAAADAATAESTAAQAKADAAQAASDAETARLAAVQAETNAQNSFEDLQAFMDYSGRVIQSETEPGEADQSPNNLWIKPSTGETFVWKTDPDTGVTDWVEVENTDYAQAAANAAAAQTAAENARDAAQTAETNAETAQQAATSAEGRAETLEQQAAASLAAANAAAADASAAQTAATAAEARATEAEAAASSAQTAAEQSFTDLQTAIGESAQIVRQELAPTGDLQRDGVLWIKDSTGESFTWNNVDLEWQVIDNATIAQMAADADAAADRAEAAELAAEGARTDANAAAGTATTAQQNASAAQAAAVAAEGRADQAEADALLAQQNAASSQSAAEAAEQRAVDAEASAAQSLNNLQSYMDTAGRIIRQEDEPTGDARNPNNLWIKDSTGQSFTFSELQNIWVEVENEAYAAAAAAADAAADRAEAAEAAATQAEADALAAQQAATAAQGTAVDLVAQADAAQAAAEAAETAADNAAAAAAASESRAVSAENVAIAADTKADAAEAKALEAAGLAGSKGQVWTQPNQPPSGVTYEWAGAIHQSTSQKLADAVLIDENLFNSPDLTSHQYATSWGGSDGNVYRSEYLPSDWAVSGRVRRVTWDTVTVLNGDIGVMVKHVAEKVGWDQPFTVGYSFRVGRAGQGLGGVGAYSSIGGTTRNVESKGSMLDLQPGITYRTWSTMAMLEAADGSARAIANPRNFIDGDWIEYSDIYAYPGAHNPDFDFFYGELSDDRQYDLWIDSDEGNTPKKWDDATNSWLPVTDQNVLDAATAADSARDAADAAEAAAVAARDDATTAAGTAATAQSNAESAQAAAVAAEGRADSAEAAALAAQQAAVAAEGRADAAEAAATQSAADANQSMLDLQVYIGTSGRVIYQDETPAEADQNVNNLWIKPSDGTSWVWDAGTLQWEQVVNAVVAQAALDADKAADAAAASQSAAEQAERDAVTAREAATAAEGRAQTAEGAAVAARDAADAAETRAETAEGKATAAAADAEQAFADLQVEIGNSGKIIYQELEPTGDDRNPNNLWIKDSTGEVFAYSESQADWVLVESDNIKQMALNADAAADAAEASQVAAEQARTDANIAAGKATTAESNANAAETAAANAASAASAAEDRATAAETAAQNAETAAEKSFTDLQGFLDNAGKIIHQEAEPAVEDRSINNLWIKDSTGVPYVWNPAVNAGAGAWEAVTDQRVVDMAADADAAADAAAASEAAAEQARSEAAQAETNASNAASAADGSKAAADQAKADANAAAAAAAQSKADADAAAVAAAASKDAADQAAVDAGLSSSEAVLAKEAAEAAQGLADAAAVDAAEATKKVNQVIASASNLVLDPGVEDGVRWNGMQSTDFAHTGNESLKVTANGSIQDIRLTDNLITSPGRIYYGEAWVRTDSTDWVGTVNLATTCYRADGSQTWPSFVGADLTPGTGQEWTKLSGYATMPADVVSFYPRISVRNNVQEGKVFYWDDFRIVDVTEAKTAIDAASAAQETADQAVTDASNAHELAGNADDTAKAALNAATHTGKNLFSTNEPSGTAPKGTIWFKHDATGTVIKQWQQTGGSSPDPVTGLGGADGSTWTKREIRSEVIANLDVGKLTGNFIDAKHIETTSLTIGGSTLGEKVDQYDSTKSTVDAATDENGNVLQSKVANLGSTLTTLETNAANTAQSKANTAKSEAIDAAAQDATEKAEAAKRVAMAAVADAENHIANGGFEYGMDGWYVQNNGIVIDDTVSHDGTKSMRTNGTGAIYTASITVDPGDTMRFVGFHKDELGGGVGRQGYRWWWSYDGGLTFPGTGDGFDPPISEDVWHRTVNEREVPANATHLRMRIAFNYSGGKAAWFDDFRLINVTSIKKLEATASELEGVAETANDAKGKVDAVTDVNGDLKADKVAGELAESNVPQLPQDKIDGLPDVVTDVGTTKGKVDGWTVTGTTYIDGGEIYTDSIKSGSIDTNSLTADTAFVGALEGVLITADVFEGKEFSGGTFRGSTVVGGLFQTSELVSRGIKISDELGLKAYDTSGNLTLNITSAGAATFTGKVVSGFGGIRAELSNSVFAGRPGLGFETGTGHTTQPFITSFAASGAYEGALHLSSARSTYFSELYLGTNEAWSIGTEYGRISHTAINGNHQTAIRNEGGSVSSALEMTPDAVWLRYKSVGASDWAQVELESNTIWLRSTTLRVTGNSVVSGNHVVSGAKNFAMPHPTKPGITLKHASTESPVSGIEYWESGVISESGSDTIELPEYFEALAKQENRSVFVAASGTVVSWTDIVDGCFMVNGAPGTPYSWLVKAERHGADFMIEEEEKSAIKENV